MISTNASDSVHDRLTKNLHNSNHVQAMYAEDVVSSHVLAAIVAAEHFEFANTGVIEPYKMALIT